MLHRSAWFDPSMLMLNILSALFLCLLFNNSASATIQISPELKSTIFKLLPGADTLGEPLDDPMVIPIYQNDKVSGYVFETNDVVDIPAYSGKPINLRVVIDSGGVIRSADVLEHHEPILLVGIPEQKLYDFAGQYIGRSVLDRIRVGGSSDSEVISVDAVTGATVTVMVVHETIMRAALKVARAYELVKITDAERQPAATVKTDIFENMDWAALTGDGSIRRLMLSRGQVDDAFIGTEAEGIDVASVDDRGETFIDLYYAYLNAPSIGRNLLGEREYQWLMGQLKEGEHGIAILANGDYSFKGSGYVRGGIFDRLQVVQNSDTISFRDLDFYRLNDVYAEGIPRFSEMAIYIVRQHYEFDPGTVWDVELLVRRQTGPLDSVFTSFNGSYQIPERLIDRPAPIVVAEPEPLWISIWQQRAFQVTVVSISLVLLTAIIFLQDWFVKYPKLLHNLRHIFLFYTVCFIGWYALGQLSIVNVLTFTHALTGDFRWELFLMDPVIFILWAYTAATILLWGRGIFCGWLCPFGALQELINVAARHLKIKQYDPPFAVHERLWALKYIILLVLFGISLESLGTAEKYAEIEPFKTSITLAFQREWWFVTYALILLFIAIFTRKFYCRYICPLGAALAIPTKFRLFDWLKRRPECGHPCQLCKVECEIQAIHPDGHINANECHHCLDCQITYHNVNKCPPLVNKERRQRRKKPPVDAQLIEVRNLDAGPP